MHWIPALSPALLRPRGARAPDLPPGWQNLSDLPCLAGELEGLQAEQAPGTAPGPCLGLLVFCLKRSLLLSLFFSLPLSYARGHTQVSSLETSKGLRRWEEYEEGVWFCLFNMGK